MSDTPRTSAAWKAVSQLPDGMFDSTVPSIEFAGAMLDHSKILERELAAEKKLADRLAVAMMKHCEPRHTVAQDVEDACQWGDAITAWKEARGE